jgi:hydrogenase maturation protease
MTPRVRVIALGQPCAGDDGFGPAVLEHLRELAAPDRLELIHVTDATALVPLLATDAPVLLVDAVLGDPPGRILEIAPDELAGAGFQPVSSHGLDVAAAIRLARVLHRQEISPRIRIVGVTIARPLREHDGLSSVVAAAVPRAAERILALLPLPAEVDGPAARAPLVRSRLS